MENKGYNAKLQKQKEKEREIEMQNKAIAHTTVEYKNAFLKELQGAALTAQDTKIIEDVKASHGTGNTRSVVPPTLVNEIWDRVLDTYPLVADAFHLDIPGDVTIPKSEGSTTDLSWYNEADPTSQTNHNFGELALEGCELVKSTEISFKLLAMSLPTFEAWLIGKLSTLIGQTLSKAIFDGDGGTQLRPTPVGIAHTLQGTDQVLTGITADNIVGAISRLDAGYVMGAVFYINHNTLYDNVANLEHNGSPLFEGGITDEYVGHIKGIPVKLASEVDGVLLSNMDAGYAINVSGEIIVGGERKNTKRIAEYFASMIVDGGVVDSKAHVVIQ